jgi:hypothetical protein
MDAKLHHPLRVDDIHQAKSAQLHGYGCEYAKSDKTIIIRCVMNMMTYCKLQWIPFDEDKHHRPAKLHHPLRVDDIH